MNGIFTNGTNGCGCNTCDIVLLLMLLNCCGCGGNMGGLGSCDIMWLILILSCICGGGNGCGCCK